MLTKTQRVATCDVCHIDIRCEDTAVMVEWEPTYEEMHEAARCEDAEDGQRFLCEGCAQDEGLVDVWMDGMRREHPGCDVTEGQL